MTYQINVANSAKGEIQKLPGHVRQRARRAITDLANNPRPANAKELRGLPGVYRIRLDKWRIIYRIDDNSQTISIRTVRLKTGPETYENLT